MCIFFIFFLFHSQTTWGKFTSGFGCRDLAQSLVTRSLTASIFLSQSHSSSPRRLLRLTCDPIAGLVQAPCIERNALGAVKAVVSAQLALASGTGQHAVSLDDAISAMKVTARDMHTKYKETSLSGLATAVRIPVAIPDVSKRRMETALDG